MYFILSIFSLKSKVLNYVIRKITFDLSDLVFRVIFQHGMAVVPRFLKARQL